VTQNRFLQLHTLTSYPASLLNRDDAGFAKRIPFGGSVRTRVSSQCLKRHWRTYTGEHALSGIEGANISIRSRTTFEHEVYAKLVAGGADATRAHDVTAAIMATLLGESVKAAKEKEEGAGKKAGKGKGKAAEEPTEAPEREPLATGQITVLGRPELAFFVAAAEAILAKPANTDLKKAVEAHFKGREQRDNLTALKLGAGLDAALFGRMVTSDILARCDAAVHVAHAFTVHEEASESDYFSAVDDLRKDAGGMGSGHIGSTELTTGLFYGYVCVDVPLLVANLSNDTALAGEVLARLVHTVATVSPGAKLGSTAPHAFSQLVLAEAGRAQPRTLANAFFDAVPSRGSVLAGAYTALARHTRELDEMYGLTTTRALAAIGPRDALGDALPAPGTLAQVAALARTAGAGG
jgi:CRISPR system Cascade subunit CasC